MTQHMQEKNNDATRKRPEGDRTIDAPSLEIDLNKFIQQIKSEESWLNNTRNAITVFKSSHMRIVLVGLHMGADMQEHTADGIISVHVLEGHIVFSAKGENTKVVAGNIITLHENIPHSVTAVEDSIFLLTMAMKK